MSLRGSLVENYQNFLRKEGDGMGSFVGTYEYNLDSKNRLVVPAPFKDLIGNTFIVRAKPGKFSHIDCFFPENFESTVNAEIEDYINKGLPADMAAAMARTCSTAVTVDAHGRICIPSKILERAHISKESVFQGMGDRFEIWDSKIHDEYNDMLAAEADKLFDAQMAENQKRYKYMSEGYMLEIKNTGIK